MSSERRIVTILFADVVGSTAIADAMDPEDVAGIMNGALSVLTEPISHHGGTLARLMGDAVLCFFGAPVAHEDDPKRACWAALDILFGAEKYAEEVARKYGLEGFGVRVGVSTGLAVVGEMGTPERAEYTAMGDAVNLASRLQSAADPGTVLINAETWMQAQQAFEAEDRGTMSIRGKVEPVRVFRLLRSRGPCRQGAGGQGEVPLVDREEELEHLCKTIGTSEDSMGRAVLITGDPGVGKSRLVTEARRRRHEDFFWAEVKCRDTYQFVSYTTARQLLQLLIGIDDPTPPETARERLKQQCDSFARDDHGAAVAGTSRGHAPLADGILSILSMFLNESLRGDSSLSALPADEVQRQVRAGYCEFLRLCAHDRPLVIVWEDVHWIDQESLAILEALAGVVTSAPLTLVLISRRGSERVSRIAAHFREVCEDSFCEILVGPLTRAHSQSLLQLLMPSHSLTSSQVEHVLQITEGNAFFLEQIAHNLSAEGASVGTVSIPPTIQATILARVDRLSTKDKQVLLAAAVAGRSFPSAVLERALAGTTVAAGLAESLDCLVRRSFLERTAIRTGPAASSGVHPDDGDLRFVQGMTHEVVYDSILRAERRTLHLKIAQAIEEIFPANSDGRAPILMRHYEAAEHWPKAAHYAQVIGERSVRLHASKSALEHFHRARDFIQNAPVNPAHILLQQRLWERIADVSFARGEYEEATTAYEKALAQSASAHDCAELHRRLAQIQEKRGRYKEAKASYERALNFLETDPNEQIAARIYSGLCLVHFHLRGFEQAQELGERAVALTQDAPDRRAHAEACNDLAIACTALHNYARARSLYDACRRIWTELGDDYGLASCFNNLGCLAKSEERWDDALREFSISLELFTVLGNQHAVARVCDNIAEVHFLKGNQGEAEKYMARAVSLLSEIGMDKSGILPEMWQSGVW